MYQCDAKHCQFLQSAPEIYELYSSQKGNSLRILVPLDRSPAGRCVEESANANGFWSSVREYTGFLFAV